MPFRSVRTYWSTGPSSGALNLEKIVKVLQGTVRVLLDVNTTEIDLRKLGIHTKETRIERDMCTPMFIAALFIIARSWNQPRCPSADEWIRKLWYIYIVEYYSAIKKRTHLSQF